MTADAWACFSRSEPHNSVAIPLAAAIAEICASPSGLGRSCHTGRCNRPGSVSVMPVTDATGGGASRWKTFGERVIYDNPWVWLGQVDVELPDGERFWHHVVRLHRAAMMVLVDGQDRVLLLWRHRFVQDRWGWELPGGLIDEGEEPAETAVRELEEETGYRAGRVEHLITFQPMVGMVDSEHVVCVMANRDRHRRFGNVRRRESGRYQIRYPGPDGRMRTGPETYERKSDADRALVMVEAQIRSGDWTDPERGKVKLADYGSAWITERPGLRPRTMDLYQWLLRKHIQPHLGGVHVGRLSTRQVREWRATLLANGVSVSVTAKAYRLLRAIMTTAVENDKLLPRNPCRIRGAGTEDAAERPVLTVAQVFELAGRVGRRPVGNIRTIPGGYRLRFGRDGEMRTSPEVYASRADAEQTLWKMASDGRGRLPP
jgi:8-oxo-dGTP pyrophosphatase MutT (NUDIX family)